MSFKKVLPYALTALLTLAVACGDDDDDGGTAPTGDTLSSAEVESMMEAMSQVMLFSPIGLGTGVAAQSEPIDETSSCPNGGTVRLFGTVSVAGSQTAPTIVGDLQQAFSGCKATSENGTLFTFSGTPTLDFSAAINAQTGAFSLTLENGGTVGFATGAKSGTCGIDTSITATVTASGVLTTGSLSGRVCNQNVSVTL